jgi:FkbM family methyltransferase
VELPATPQAIIDLGAHVGMSVLYFRERYPAARILAVEPNPANFAKLERNVGGLPDVELRPVAAGGEPGTAWLDVGQESWRSMLVRNPAGREAIRVPVRTTDLTSFLAVLGDLHRDLLPVPPERFFGLFEGLRVEGQDTTSTFRAFREVR